MAESVKQLGDWLAFAFYILCAIVQTMLRTRFSVPFLAEEEAFFLVIPCILLSLHAHLENNKGAKYNVLLALVVTLVTIIIQATHRFPSFGYFYSFTVLVNNLIFNFVLPHDRPGLKAQSFRFPNVVSWSLFVIPALLSTYTSISIALVIIYTIRCRSPKLDALRKVTWILLYKLFSGAYLVDILHFVGYFPSVTYAAWLAYIRQELLAKNTSLEKALLKANVKIYTSEKYLQMLERSAPPVSEYENIFPINREGDVLALGLAEFVSHQRRRTAILQNHAEAKTRMLTRLRMKCHELECQLEMHNKACASLRIERERFTTDLTTETKKSAVLKLTVRQLTSTVRELQYQRDHLEDDVAELEHYKALAAPQLGRYEHEIDHLDAAYKGSISEIEKVRAESKTNCARAARENVELREHVTRMEDVVRKKDQVAARFQEDKDDLSLAIGIKEIELQRRAEQAKKLFSQAKIALLTRETNRLSAINRELQVVAASTEQRIGDMTSETLDLRRRIARSEETYAKKEGMINSLQDELARLGTENCRLQNALTNEGQEQAVELANLVVELKVVSELFHAQKREPEVNQVESEQRIMKLETKIAGNKQFQPLRMNNYNLAIENDQSLLKLAPRGTLPPKELEPVNQLELQLLDYDAKKGRLNTSCAQAARANEEIGHLRGVVDRLSAENVEIRTQLGAAVENVASLVTQVQELNQIMRSRELVVDASNDFPNRPPSTSVPSIATEINDLKAAQSAVQDSSAPSHGDSSPIRLQRGDREEAGGSTGDSDNTNIPTVDNDLQYILGRGDSARAPVVFAESANSISAKDRLMTTTSRNLGGPVTPRLLWSSNSKKAVALQLFGAGATPRIWEPMMWSTASQRKTALILFEGAAEEEDEEVPGESSLRISSSNPKTPMEDKENGERERGQEAIVNSSLAPLHRTDCGTRLVDMSFDFSDSRSSVDNMSSAVITREQVKRQSDFLAPLAHHANPNEPGSPCSDLADLEIVTLDPLQQDSGADDIQGNGSTFWLGFNPTSLNCSFLGPLTAETENPEEQIHEEEQQTTADSSFAALHTTDCGKKLMKTSFDFPDNQSSDHNIPAIDASGQVAREPDFFDSLTDYSYSEPGSPSSDLADLYIDEMGSDLGPGVVGDPVQRQSSAVPAPSSVRPMDGDGDAPGTTRSNNWGQRYPKISDLRTQISFAGSMEATTRESEKRDLHCGVMARSVFDRVGRSAGQTRSLPIGLPLLTLDINAPRTLHSIKEAPEEHSQNGLPDHVPLSCYLVCPIPAPFPAGPTPPFDRPSVLRD
ncbi:hypothetical protein FRB96_001430 [Tulasnella sp. 330]|nr:hypothetical protein FRB96_001430 [Tulasnella sp. 330]